MDTGKVVDCEPMSRICKQCNAKEPMKAMEAVGAKRLFKRFVKKHMACDIRIFMEMVKVRATQQ